MLAIRWYEIDNKIRWNVLSCIWQCVVLRLWWIQSSYKIFSLFKLRCFMHMTKGFVNLFIYLRNNMWRMLSVYEGDGNWEINTRELKKAGNMSEWCEFCKKDEKSIKFDEALKSPVASIHSTYIRHVTDTSHINFYYKKSKEMLFEARKMRNGSGTKTNWRLNCCWFFIHGKIFRSNLWAELLLNFMRANFKILRFIEFYGEASLDYFMVGD